MSFIFRASQYFLSSGSFAAQSLYSASLCRYREQLTIFVIHHYHVLLSAYYMQYIYKIGRDLITSISL